MNLIYNAGIHLYAGMARLVGALGHRKASRMVKGQKATFEALREFDRQSPNGSERIWIHAASLGEFEQGRPVIEWIREHRPSARILLSFFSPSGYEVRKDYPGADCVVYLPFDTAEAARSFVMLARPSMAIFVKYEFWGNYLEALSEAAVPTYLISAIFRENQIFFRSYGSMFRNMLGRFDRLFVQDEPSVQLLESAGVGRDRIIVSGDTRFDRVSDTLRAPRQVPEVEAWINATGGGERFTLIAGSSWEPDEEIYFPWLKSHPEVRAIIAPHEFDARRLESFRNRLGSENVIFHSQLGNVTQQQLAAARYLIIDCFGLLSSLYRFGSLAYVGGGFGAGIHSVTEAAVYSEPVAFGPRYHKFREAVGLIAAGGAFSVSSPKDFDVIATRMIKMPSALASAGAAAGRYIADNTGATERITASIFG